MHEHFYRLDALIIPHENARVVLDPKCTDVVRGKRKNRIAIKFKLTIQLSKGVRRVNPRFYPSRWTLDRW